MKSYLAILVIVLVFFSCSNAKSLRENKESKTEAKTQWCISKWYSCLRSQVCCEGSTCINALCKPNTQ